MNYVLIDDDELIHELWKLASRDKEVKLSCFSSVEEFLELAECLNKESEVYIDSNLKSSRGEEEAIKVYEAGFSRIFIATGYDPDSISAPDFVKAVVGKRPPF